jgi:Zn-finger nucleic acid-binding protein
MKCPKCDAKMQLVMYDDIGVDRCTGCKGLWFDMLEHEHLAAIEGSEAIDFGSAAIGERFNEVDDINCPKCNSAMLKMVDAQQSHIWYEGCPSCFGVFFDAGEFRDYKEKTVFDFFRDLFTKERF